MTSADEVRRREAIRPVKRRVEDRFIARSGAVCVDIAEKTTRGQPTGELAIVVTVRNKRPPARVPASQLIPAEVDGVPTDVVQDELLLHAPLLRLEDAAPDLGPEVHATVVGGIGMGPCRSVRTRPPGAPAGIYVTVGTLGVLVTDRGGSGQVMGLTNFHVACVDDAWAVGDAMCHPSRADGGRCPQDVFGTLARAALSGSVDGAAVLLAPGKPYDLAIAQVGPVAGSAEAVLGSQVRKRGRTTGLTVGRVVSTDATLSIDYSDGIGVRTLRDQLRVEAIGARAFGDLGDSGSAVVDAANRVVGLYFAGNAAGNAGFANPIGKVLAELDVVVLKGI